MYVCMFVDSLTGYIFNIGTSMNKVLAVGLCLCLSALWTEGKVNNKFEKYSNIWVAKVRGGEEVAKRIARDLSYTYKGQVGEFVDHYKFVKDDYPEVSLRDSSHLTNSLLDSDEVTWAEQQRLVEPKIYFLEKKRKTTDDKIKKEKDKLKKLLAFLKEKKENHKSKVKCRGPFSCLIKIPADILEIMKSFKQGDIRQLGAFSTKPAPRSQLKGYSKVKTEPIGLLSGKLSAYELRYNDPFWRLQWNMQDYRTVDMPVMDHNVVPVHEMGITGKKVTVAVVDNGVEHDCPELIDNFVAELSYDTCKDIPGSHPSPDAMANYHGTSCAGIIAMKPNNEKCGVGIAYDAKIVGIRAICDNEQTNYATSIALIHELYKTDIYSNSWGFYGEGIYVLTLDYLTELALKIGTKEGREGKGAIYVKSAGNDKEDGDNCAPDAELNNVYVISVAGADQFGKPVYYSERCTAVFTTAYTLNRITEGIVAPVLNGECSTEFSGTSASCPEVSAIIALALEANHKLTYRDVMHLIAMSAEVAPLADNDGTWYRNGRGFWVSNDFGFGLMNAENMVTLAKNWKNVPERRTCVETVTMDPPMKLSFDSPATIIFKVKGCKGSAANEVNYLEHIELESEVEYSYRGHITIFVTSPAGTKSMLLEPRPKDDDPDGLEGWSIMSTHNWGEHSRGTWNVTYQISTKSLIPDSGKVKQFTLRLHGTKRMPSHYKKKREYAAFRLPDGQTS